MPGVTVPVMSADQAVTPSVRVQLGTTMAVQANCPTRPDPRPAPQPLTPSYTMPLSTSSTININMLMAQQPPPLQQPLQPIYTSIVPVLPPPHPLYKAQVMVEAPQPPGTLPKPSWRERNSSTTSTASSGIGSNPSSPPTPNTPRTKPNSPELDSESTTWSSLDDTRSERSFNSSSASSHDVTESDSACSLSSPEDKEDALTFDRVGIVSDDKVVVMVQLSCESDEATNSLQFINLVAAIARACAQYYRKKEAIQETMNATQIGQVVMFDRRPVKEHVADVSKDLGETITIMRADCRRINSKGYVGTYVQDNVIYKENSTVAKTGVIVVLRKNNRLAPVREFSEQLCLHILAHRPDSLGTAAYTTNVDRLGRRRRDHNNHSLLTQRFYCDQTCNVFEAAKRSFVEVTDFVIYG